MDCRDRVHRVNCLANDLEALYHQAALKLGLSDSVMFVLYMIHDMGDGCRLQDICTQSGISKQTINSALRKLEKEEILYLTPDGGKAKRVHLTEKGRMLMEKTVARLYRAECAAFGEWSEAEISQYLALMEKYNNAIRREIEKMEETDL